MSKSISENNEAMKHLSDFIGIRYHDEEVSDQPQDIRPVHSLATHQSHAAGRDAPILNKEKLRRKFKLTTDVFLVKASCQDCPSGTNYRASYGQNTQSQLT